MQTLSKLLTKNYLLIRLIIDLIKRYFNTIKFLKFSQIFYRIKKYFIKTKVIKKNLPIKKNIVFSFLEIYWRDEVINGSSFTFLNINKKVITKNDWNNKNFTKLWLYNLHYFDFLNSKNHKIFIERNKKIIYKWIDDNDPFEGVGWEPYPSSLRIVNWIRWLILLKISDEKIEKSLALQIRWLNKNLEYDLLGNHLMANAKALVFGGFFFKNLEAENWKNKGIRILNEQLKEQILNDGGHFERSPMYHCIILEDLLDLNNLISSNKFISEANLEKNLKFYSRKMLVWIEKISHPDGKIPFFNDATFGITSEISFLREYYYKMNKNLKLKEKKSDRLKNSGFRTLKNSSIFCICDVGSIKPDYMPGHSHAETLSFEASFKGERFIVNSGISSYEKNKKRIYERSTKTHSTIEIDNKNSSDIWSGFRVGNRAKIINKGHSENGNKFIYAEHDGYKNLTGSPTHLRLWILNNDNLEILDQIKGKGIHKICLRFYLHPECKVKDISKNSLLVSRNASNKKYFQVFIQWEYPFNLSIKNTFWNNGFNTSIKNKCINLTTYSSCPLVNKTTLKIKS